MTTFLSEQRWARTIFVALLVGLVLWPEASFAQNVASQDQAGVPFPTFELPRGTCDRQGARVV